MVSYKTVLSSLSTTSLSHLYRLHLSLSHRYRLHLSLSSWSSTSYSLIFIVNITLSSLSSTSHCLIFIAYISFSHLYRQHLILSSLSSASFGKFILSFHLPSYICINYIIFILSYSFGVYFFLVFSIWNYIKFLLSLV